MHPNPAFHIDDPRALLALIRMRPFATLIVLDSGRPILTQSPVLGRETDTGVSLCFHLAAEDRVAVALRKSGRGLIHFTGPDAYISPDWYGLSDQVPTWNYLSAEAEGPCLEMSCGELTDFLDTFFERFETRLPAKTAWTKQQLSSAHFDTISKNLIGFDLRPDRFEGVRKLSQNKPRKARVSAGEALAISGGDSAIAAMMMNDKV